MAQHLSPDAEDRALDILVRLASEIIFVPQRVSDSGHTVLFWHCCHCQEDAYASTSGRKYHSQFPHGGWHKRGCLAQEAWLILRDSRQIGRTVETEDIVYSVISEEHALSKIREWEDR